MFFFKKKNTASVDLSWLKTDMHSHLVPAIDDGAPDAETSIRLIKGLQELGFSRFITTPHILWELYPNTAGTINEGLQVLEEELQQQKLNVDIHAAAEYFIDDHFIQELEAKKPLLTLKDNLVLVEFSMVTASLELKDALFEMQLQNYQPVLAHPERYIYLQKQKSFFDDLKEAGCLFQLNLLSLTPYYGNAVQELAEYLIKKEYYDLIGSDLHHDRHLAIMQKELNTGLLKKLRDSGRIRNAQL